MILRKLWVRWHRILLSLVLAVGVMAFLLAKINVAELVQVLMGTSPAWISLGVLLFLLNQLLKALRYRILLYSKRDDFSRLFSIQCLQALLNGLLPAGMGELSYIYLLKRWYQTPIPEGASVLLVARATDVGLFAALFIALEVFAWDRLRNPYLQSVAILMIALAIFLLALYAYIVRRGGGIRWLKRFNQLRWGQPLRRFVEQYGTQVLNTFERIPPSRYFVSVIFSTLMWMVMFGVFYSTINALHYDLSIEETLFLFLILWPLSLLPIKGIGDFGTHEGGWTLALFLLGYSSQEAIVLAVGSHMIFLLNTFLILIPPALLWLVKRRTWK